MQLCNLSHAYGAASFRDRGDVNCPNNGAGHWIHLAHTPKPSHYKSSLFSNTTLYFHIWLPVIAWQVQGRRQQEQEQLHFSFLTRKHATQQRTKPIACNLCIVQTWSINYIQSLYKWNPLHTLQSLHIFPAFPVPLPWKRSNLNCFWEYQTLVIPVLSGLEKHLMRKRDNKHVLKHFAKFRPEELGFIHWVYPSSVDTCNSPILSAHSFLPRTDSGARTQLFTTPRRT